MNANERRVRRARLALAMVAVAASCAAHAGADAPAGPQASPAAVPEWPDADTVEDLLRRETRAAVAAQGRRQAARDASLRQASPPESTPSPDRLDLSAIYGLGKRLDVEVLLNGRRLRYRHGRKWPDEAPDGDGVYALRAIEGRCVRLDNGATGRQVCLSTSE